MNRSIYAVFVAALLVVASFSFYYLDRGSRELHSKAEIAIDELQKKRKNVSEMIENARQRALILLRMLHEKDPFLRDDLFMLLDEPAVRFYLARQSFVQTRLTDAQQAVFNDALKQVVANELIQLEVMDLMSSGEMDRAAEQLFTGILPGQDVIVGYFKRILGLIEDETTEVQKQLYLHLQSSQQSISVLALMFLLVAIAIITLLVRNLSLGRARLIGSEAIKSGVFRTSLDAIICTSESGIISQFNSGAEVLFGYSAEQMIGKSVMDLLTDSDRHELDDFFRLQLSVGVGRSRNFRVETQCIHQVGSVIPVDLSISDIGVPGEARFCWIVRDLTESKAIEGNLQSRNRRQQDIIDSFFGFIGIFSLDGILLETNNALLEASGLTRGEMIECYFPDTYWWSFSEDVGRDISNALGLAAKGEVVRYDSPIRMADENIACVDIMFAPLRNKAGEIVQIIGFGVDVTDRLKVENELKLLNDELESRVVERTAELTEMRNREELGRIRYQAIIETAVDAIITIDDKGLITSFNPAARKMFGYRSDEVLAENVSMLMPDPYRTEHDEYIQNHLKTGVGKIIGIERELVGLRKELDLFPLMLAVSKTEVAGEVGFTGILRDLTEQKKTEYQLELAMQQSERRRQEAEIANKAKSDFLSSMSHELRTPLNAIIGFAQILEYADLGEDDKSSVQQILSAGLYLLDLIKDILDLSGIESGRLELSFAAVDLRQTVKECLSLLDATAKSHHITVRFDLSAGQMVWADRVRVKQVVFNLLSNAIKYNQDGGHVFVESRIVKDGWLQLRVTDSGRGISSDKLEELFQPFNRLGAECGIIHGSGIGLTVARRIVDQMGGKIGVESQPGIGSSFYVDLPLVPHDQIETQEPSTP